MKNIYLVRHGQNEDNANGILNGHRDLPLTQIGIDQANELAQKIKQSGIKVDSVYSSPLSRALKTAEIVCEINKFPAPKVLDLLIERDFGDLTGTPQADIIKNCGDRVLITEKIVYFLDTHNVETFPQMIDRAKKLFEYLKQDPSENILLVAHGDFGKMIYAAYYNLPWEDVLRQFHFGNSEMILMSPDSPPENAHVFTIKQFNT